RLCAALAEGAMRDTRSPARSGGDRVSRITDPVDRLVQDLFLARGAREKDDNLIFVRERLLRSEEDRAALLDLYRQVWSGKRVRDDDTNPLRSLLKLSGIVGLRIGDCGLRIGRRNGLGLRTRRLPYSEIRNAQRAP